ncbi:hypothetical protein Ancab_004986, partial [Ancistrocladus abbreviatus]
SPNLMFLGNSKAVGLPMPSSGALRLKRFAGFWVNKPVVFNNNSAIKGNLTSYCHTSKLPTSSLLSKNQEAPNLVNKSDTHASWDSLHDSNIKNMNRIHLSKPTHITAEEIWEVGRRLGVHSDEDDRAIIQRIKCLQENEQ